MRSVSYTHLDVYKRQVLMQAANSEAQEPTEDVMDDADVAGLAMGWMSKGD